MFHAVYSRWFSCESDAYPTLAECVRRLEHDHEHGEIYAVGIYDDATGVIYPYQGVLDVEMCVAEIRSVCRVPDQINGAVHEYPNIP